MKKLYIFNTYIKATLVSQVYANSEEEARELLDIPIEVIDKTESVFVSGIDEQDASILMDVS